MYVMVYCMGPIGSVYSRFGVQLTDSPHVVINTLLQTRIGMKNKIKIKNQKIKKSKNKNTNTY